MTAPLIAARAAGARQLSRGLDTHWSDMDREAVRLWLSDHGEEGERLYRDLMSALVCFGGWIKTTKAHERRGEFDVEAFVNDALDDMCAPLAEEVREWLGG